MKVLGLLLLAVAVANANFLQNAEDGIHTFFENMKDGAKEWLAELQGDFLDRAENFDDAIDHVKEGVKTAVRTCGQNEECNQAVLAIIDHFLAHAADSKDKRQIGAIITATKAGASAAVKRCAASTACKAVVVEGVKILVANSKEGIKKALDKVKSIGGKVVESVKKWWNGLWGKRFVITAAGAIAATKATAVAAVNACAASPKCQKVIVDGVKVAVSKAKDGVKKAMKALNSLGVKISNWWKNLIGKRFVVTAAGAIAATKATATAAINACAASAKCKEVVVEGAKIAVSKAKDGVKKALDALSSLGGKISKWWNGLWG